MADRIIQIIPADGWYSIHVWGCEPYAVPLAAWALVERDDGSTYVTGLDADDQQQPRECRGLWYVYGEDRAREQAEDCADTLVSEGGPAM